MLIYFLEGQRIEYLTDQDLKNRLRYELVNTKFAQPRAESPFDSKQGIELSQQKG
ncbi:hypothetical protein QQ008_16675 [Fulvivirgaceae bacterium BMA10]|uniref:Uncharacterized protein n=1 Tax=Splendidivirga corallicola TaxID=3051826 RepID=A0ABT8KU67_9BACT|nr:hypothetical protein [Fulvivirgaceae bacterium BMA10]